MKKFLQFSGLIAAGLALIAFIFLLAGNGLVYRYNSSASFVPGTIAIFGGDLKGAILTLKCDLAPTALIAWIFVLLAMLALIAISVLPLLKVKALDKFAGLIALCAAGLLFVAGILLFFTKVAFSGANSNAFDDYHLTFAFVFAGILSILAGAVAACPACMKLLGKK